LGYLSAIFKIENALFFFIRKRGFCMTRPNDHAAAIAFARTWKPGQPTDPATLATLRTLSEALNLDDDAFERVCSVYIENALYDKALANSLVGKLATVFTCPTFETLLTVNQVMQALNADWGAHTEVLPLAVEVLAHPDLDVVHDLIFPSVVAIGHAAYKAQDHRLEEMLIEKGRQWQSTGEAALANHCALGLCLAQTKESANCFGKTVDLDRLFGHFGH
jgi:hypothetical protein